MRARSVRLRLLGLLGVLGVLVVVVCVLIALARYRLLNGLNEVHRAQDELHAATIQRAPSIVLKSASLHVARAHDDFSAADLYLTPISPLVEHLSFVPRIGHQLAAAPVAARLADQATGGIGPLLQGLVPVADRWNAPAHHRPTVPVLLGALAAGRPHFAAACGQLDQAQVTRRQMTQSTAAELSSSLASLDRELPQLQVLCRTLLLLPGLAGFHQPQTYLIAYQNPDMLRATGGFIGSAGLLTLKDGSATQDFHGTWLSNENASIPPPEPMAYYNRERGWLFRDSNWSPDFPTSAALERYFLKLDLHRNADGVINVTPAAVSQVLAATGPIYSPEYRRYITAANVAALADYYTHRTMNYGPLVLRNADNERKQFIQIVAKHIFDTFRGLSLTQWLDLGTSLSSSFSRGDILLNFQSHQAQSLIQLAHASGSISHTQADFLEIVDSNLSYNKMNRYVQLRTGYNVRIRSDRWLDVHLTVRFDNPGAPAYWASASYGPGEGRYGGPLDYADFVRIYAPAGAQLVDQSGWFQPWSPGTAYGKTMFSGYLVVPVHQNRILRLRYVVPPNVFTSSGGARYSLLIPHQPGSHPDSLDVSVTRDDGSVATWRIDRPTTDWSTSISVAPRSFQPIPLSAEIPSSVASGHWIEPHAYLAGP